MRCFAIVFAVLATLYATSAVPTNLEVLDARADDVGFGQILECIVDILNVGVPEFGVPSLNPLDIDRYFFDLTAWGVPGITGGLTVTELLFTGLLDLDIQSIESSEDGDNFEISAVIVWPETVLATNHDGDFDILGLLTLWGNGRLDYTLNDLRIEFGISGTMDDNGLVLSSVTFLPTIGGFADFTITGLYDDEERSAEISQDILENGADDFNNASQLLNEILGPLIVEIINRTNSDGGAGLIGTLLNACIEAKH